MYIAPRFRVSRSMSSPTFHAIPSPPARLAISRMRSGSDKRASTRTSEAGHLLGVLEQYMHTTGARFTDVFSLLDRREQRGKGNKIVLRQHKPWAREHTQCTTKNAT